MIYPLFQNKLFSRSRLVFFLSFIAIVTATIFSSCSSNTSSCIDDTSSTAYLYLQADPISLDPRLGGDRRSQILIRELFEGLVRIGKDGNAQLALAKEYTVSSDGLIYTFTLNPSTWSNGDPVTAHDFVYSWKSVIDPNFATPYSYAFYVIKNAKRAHMKECSMDDIGIRAVADLQLEITLQHPAPYFLELASNPLYAPVHKKTVETNLQWSAGTSNTSYICNGPFVLKDQTMKSHFILEKNPTYWNKADEAKLTTLHFAIIEDVQTCFNLYKSGQLDWIGEPNGAIPLEMVRELDSMGVLKKLSKGGVYWYVISTLKPHLRSKTIRKALATAINRKEITDQLLQAGETPAFSILPQSMTMLTSPLFQDNNAKLARRLFSQGLKEMGIEKKEYPTLVISHWSDSRDRMIAETVQAQLINTLGIDVKLASTDWSSYFKKVTSGDLQMGGFGWYLWFYDPMYNLEYIKFKESGINGSGWQNSEYIHLLDEADQTQDMTRRRHYLKSAEELAMAELPVIPIFYQTYKYATSPRLKGEVLSRVGLMELKWLEKE